MIPFEFDYFRPTSLTEAIQLFGQLENQGKKPIYYAGGTEIISFSRVNKLYTGAVIDIKDIPECHIYQSLGAQLVTGACLTLTQISKAPHFPLLSEMVRGASDHTNRNKITVGGMINSRMIYKEAVLPFLLADSHVVIAGVRGIRSAPINQVFNQKLQLEKGELLVQVLTERSYLKAPFITIKKTKQEEVDYPLVRLAALKKDGHLRVAFSGVCAFPFRVPSIEEVINDSALDVQTKIKRTIKLMPAPIIDDARGSAEYRVFVLGHTLREMFEKIEGVHA